MINLKSLPVKENLCAVVTSFNPDNGINERLSRISSEVDKIVLIDNNSEALTVYMLEELSVQLNIHVIFNKKNLGVAAALNQGVLWAKKNNYDWVILFDQDTLISSDMVEILCSAYREINTKEDVGIIGPGYFNIESKNNTSHPPSGNTFIFKEARSVITSGSLFSINLFDKIGPFQEDLFIDFVDIEYCLRARVKGFKVIKLETLLMQHRIGSETKHGLLWKEIGTSNHPPWRRYYMIRNNIIVAKKYFQTDPKWVINFLFNGVKSTISIFFFEKQKFRKLKYSALGVIDGISGRVNRTIK